MKKLLCLLLCIYPILPASARTKNFGILKSMINNRQNEAKVYIPDRAVVGSKIEVIVDAPGASKVILFKSNNEGESEYQDAKLRVPADRDLIGESSRDNASFIVDIPLGEYSELINKDIYFDAIAEYKNDYGVERKKAMFFGANAAFSNVNSVRIVAPAKNNAGAEAIIRSIAPGLLNRPAQY